MIIPYQITMSENQAYELNKYVPAIWFLLVGILVKPNLLTLWLIFGSFLVTFWNGILFHVFEERKKRKKK